MANYSSMYKHLFNAQTQAIEILQKAQLATEEMYISAPDPDIRVLELPNRDGDDTE